MNTLVRGVDDDLVRGLGRALKDLLRGDRDKPPPLKPAWQAVGGPALPWVRELSYGPWELYAIESSRLANAFLAEDGAVGAFVVQGLRSFVEKLPATVVRAAPPRVITHGRDLWLWMEWAAPKREGEEDHAGLHA